MTQNQLQLMKINEDVRHNRETEALTSKDLRIKRGSAIAKGITDAVKVVVPTVKVSKHI